MSLKNRSASATIASSCGRKGCGAELVPALVKQEEKREQRSARQQYLEQQIWAELLKAAEKSNASHDRGSH